VNVGPTTRWGGLPLQEPWVVLLGPDGQLLETELGSQLSGVRPREGLYQISEPPSDEQRVYWMERARAALEGLLDEPRRHLVEIGLLSLHADVEDVPDEGG